MKVTLLRWLLLLGVQDILNVGVAQLLFTLRLMRVKLFNADLLVAVRALDLDCLFLGIAEHGVRYFIFERLQTQFSLLVHERRKLLADFNIGGPPLHTF